MPRNASEILVDTLIEWGVEVVFGLPGDGINGIMEALRTRQDRIRFIQVRHEESAAFMACGYAKWTGKIGCCLATSGPGGIHLLNGLYDAKLDHAPVVAITGLQYHDLLGTFTQQDVDLDKLFADVAVYNTRVMSAAHMGNAASLACRTSLARRGVAHLSIPVDVQEEPDTAVAASSRNVGNHVSNTMAEGLRLPAPELIDRAAALLNAGQRVAILAGCGALGASAELLRTSELLAAPIIKALLGKAVVPDDHPNTTGGIGLLGTRASQQAMEECDTLLIVGSTFPYIEYYPKPGQARVVQIDLDAERISLRAPVEVGLVGDARATLEALNAKLTQKADRSFLSKAQVRMADWRSLMEEAALRPGTPMKPARVVHELNKLLPENAIIATDSGQNTELCARHIDLRGTMMFSVSGLLASMACGLPYAIAAAIAHPDRPVLAVVGDGGFTMLLGELATCVKYQLPVKILVMKNNTFGQIKWEQMMFLGNPEFGCDLQPIDFATVAKGMGARGFHVADPERCAAVLAEALAVPGPAVIEAEVDPNEPMMPPKPPEAYVKHLRQALEKGTPGAKEIERALSEAPSNRILDS